MTSTTDLDALCAQDRALAKGIINVLLCLKDCVVLPHASNLLTSLIVVGLILTYSRRERAGNTLVMISATGFVVAGWRSLLRPFGFVGEGLRRTDIAAKEWIGLFVYYVTGKSDEFLSRPKPSAPHDNAIEHSAQPG